LIAVLEVARRRGKLSAKSFYVEIPDFVYKDEKEPSDHACVGILLKQMPERYANKQYVGDRSFRNKFAAFGKGKLLLLDPGTDVFGTQTHTKRMRPLKGRQLLANYYVNCGEMMLPDCKRALPYFRKGLAFDPKSVRARECFKKCR
jgi:hypothetical protein